MKKAPNVKLSLRKLFTAMLAVGPVAILPGPLWATLPTSSSYTVSAGTASIATAGSQATITASDRAILTWGNSTVVGDGTATNFKIDAGETYNFVTPSGGSVLNKVAKGTSPTLAPEAAIIDGTLVSTGRVFVLSTNGDIRVGGGAAINTGGGLVLSTLTESSDFPYTVNGNLTFAGTSNGNISIGATGTATNILGNLDAAAGAVTFGGAAVVGNVVLRSVGNAQALALASNAASSITGTFSATTNNGAISQTNALTVGNTTSLNAGTAAITLNSATNNFTTVSVTAGSASLTDANNIDLGASAIGTALAPGNLTVSAGGNITTSGAVATSNVTSLSATAAGNITYNNGSSAATFNASTTNGSVTLNATGNVVVGTVTAGGPLQSVTVTNGGAGYTATPTLALSSGSATLNSTISGNAVATIGVDPTTSTAYTSLPTVTITGGGTQATSAASVSAVLTATSIANITISGGGNYTGTPTISFGGGGGAGAAATALQDTNGKITAIQITNVGSGYTSAPSVTITGTLTGQAAPLVTANLQPTTIASLTLNSGGTGYTSVNPADYVIAVTPLGGSSANMTLSGTPANTAGVLTALPTATISQLYSQVPIVTISGGGSSAATNATTTVNAGSAVSLSSTGTLTTSGNVFGSAVAVTGANITNSGGIVTTGSFTANATTGDLSVGNVTNASSISLAALGNITQQGSSTLTGVANGTLSVSANNVTLSNSNVLANTKLALTGGNVTVNSTSGSGVRVTNSAVRGDLRLTSSGAILFGTGSGTLSETVTVGGNLIANTTGTSVTSVTVTNNANNTSLTGTRYTGNLANATVSFSGGGGSGAAGTPVFDANGRLTGITITNSGSGYTSKPTITVSGTGVTTATIGSSAVAITGNVSGATITDDPDVTLVINGAMSLNTKGGNVALQSTIGSGRGYGQLGQLNANTAGLETAPANVTIHERTTIGVGNVTANVLTLNSTTGNIIFQPTNIPTIATNASAITTISARATSTNATITQTTNITTNSGNSVFNTSGGTVLDNSSNVFGGNIQVIGGANNVFVANSTFTLQNSTTVTGSNRLSITTVNGDNWVNASRNITVQGNSNVANATLNSAGGVSITGNITYANLTISAANNLNATTSVSVSSNATVNNTLTVSAVSGNVSIPTTSNASLSTVVLGETPGTTTLATNGNLTIRGSTSGAVVATAGNNATYAGTYGIALGNLSAGSLTVEAKNGTNNTATDGVSGDITQQSGTTLAIYGPISATVFGGNVTLANSGNNFGQISASTGTPTSGSITIVERDTAKIGNISTTGAVKLTSSFGGIIEDPNANITINAASLTATASNGSVLLGNTAKTTGNSTTGNIQSATLSASGAAAIASTGNLVLTASSANSLTATSADTLTQSGPLSVYGLASFKAANGIALNDAANNFGPVSLEITNANKNVSITEGGTLNLRKVAFSGAAGNGTFTATSVNGDIIDSGLGGVVLGGRVGFIGTGVVTLNAANGNITIDDPTSDIASLSGSVFNAKNVTLAVLGTTDLVLGAANVTTTIPGNLTATSATGHIVNAGNLVIGGQASFQTGVGNITLSQAGNQFGSIRFAGNAVAISQSNDMKIVTGSSAIKPAQFSSGGNISILNAGGVVAFADTATLSAVGSITLPKLVQAAGTITVNASGTKDLSALSLSGDLASKTPANYGTGTYVPPTP